MSGDVDRAGQDFSARSLRPGRVRCRHQTRTMLRVTRMSATALMGTPRFGRVQATRISIAAREARAIQGCDRMRWPTRGGVHVRVEYERFAGDEAQGELLADFMAGERWPHHVSEWVGRDAVRRRVAEG